MENSESKFRALPVVKIKGVPFYADGRLDELREVGVPWNIIQMKDIRYADGANGILFDTKTHNIFNGELVDGKLPEHVKRVVVPPMKELDPIGVARRFGYPDNMFVKDQPQKKANPEQGLDLGGINL